MRAGRRTESGGGGTLNNLKILPLHLSLCIWYQKEMKRKKENVVITPNEHIKLLLYWWIDVWMLACLSNFHFTFASGFDVDFMKEEETRWEKNDNKQTKEEGRTDRERENAMLMAIINK